MIEKAYHQSRLQQIKLSVLRSPRILLGALSVVLVGAIGSTYALTSTSAAVIGTTYYVSPSGNNKNTGRSKTAPWKSIAFVDTHKFKAGDTILFKGHATYDGHLSFSSSDSGTAAHPITVSSYGNGVATLNGGTGNAIYAHDTAGLRISHVNLVGSGSATNTGSGLNFYNDFATGRYLSYIEVANVTATGFKNGLSLASVHPGNGYSNVTVKNSTFSKNRLDGLATSGPSFNATSPNYANRNVTVSNVTANGNLGDSTLSGSNDSGNGIVLGSVRDGEVTNSSAADNGADCIASACGVGIWTYDSDKVVIRHNISFRNHTGSNTDGDGFDLDQNTSNSILEYNYSYDNDGAGILLFGASDDQSHTGNTVRFNVSQNDGQKNTEAGIVVYGNVNHDAIYNDSVYVSPTAGGGNPTDIRVYSIGSLGGNTVRNNIFEAVGGQWPAVVLPTTSTAVLDFQENDYYGPFELYWGTTTYSSLAALQRATGEEMYDSTPLGTTANPILEAAGDGPPLTDPSLLNTLSQYRLTTGSPAKNAGLNLTALYGADMGGQDFYGATIPQPGGVSIGAAE